MPIIENSNIPGLLGITSLKNKRTLIDLNTNKLYFLGPGDYDLPAAMPPGTECYQCEQSPSGHLILPCCEYEGATEKKDSEMTLVTQKETASASSSSASCSKESGRLVGCELAADTATSSSKPDSRLVGCEHAADTATSSSKQE